MQGNFQAFTISYIVENFLSETRCKREKFKLLPRLRIFFRFCRPSVAKTADPAENYPIRGLFPRLFFARAKLNFILRRAARSRFKRQAAALSLPFGVKREGEPLKTAQSAGGFLRAFPALPAQIRKYFQRARNILYGRIKYIRQKYYSKTAFA